MAQPVDRGLIGISISTWRRVHEVWYLTVHCFTKLLAVDKVFRRRPAIVRKFTPLLLQRNLDLLRYALDQILRSVLRFPSKVSAPTVPAGSRVRKDQACVEVAPEVLEAFLGSEQGRLGLFSAPESDKRSPNSFGHLVHRDLASLDEVVTLAAVAQLRRIVERCIE